MQKGDSIGSPFCIFPLLDKELPLPKVVRIIIFGHHPVIKFILQPKEMEMNGVGRQIRPAHERF
jgi:hypothetical protein